MNIGQLARQAGVPIDTVRYYERQQLLPTAARQVESALADYRGGAGTLTAVFKARRADLERRQQVNALELEAALIWASLELRLIPQELAGAGRDGK